MLELTAAFIVTADETPITSKPQILFLNCRVEMPQCPEEELSAEGCVTVSQSNAVLSL